MGESQNNCGKKPEKEHMLYDSIYKAPNAN